MHLRTCLLFITCVFLARCCSSLADKNGEPSPQTSKDLPEPGCSDCTCKDGKDGAPGTPGTNGLKGDKGDVGERGLPGETGPPGRDGLKGDRGQTGLAGSKGERGSAGPPGAQGEVGETGEAGPAGAQGVQGVKGDSGPPGPAGTAGAAGQKGAKGDPGTATSGSRGPPGPRGLKGEPGPRGSAGAKGAAGRPGNPGTAGAKGSAGSPGATGTRGPVGPKGAKGLPGQRGSPGQKGAQGSRGLQGPRGVQGPTGRQGPPGHRGATGATGAKGSQGDCSSQCSSVIKQCNAKYDSLNAKYTALRNEFVKKMAYIEGKLKKLESYHTTSCKLGQSCNPATSCYQILQSNWRAPNGPYYIKTKTAAGYSQVYCQMTDLPGCGKGFTLVMKVDGAKTTFRYDSGYWTNKAEYNTYAAKTGLDSLETKSATYWSTPFSQVCLGMKSRFIPWHKYITKWVSVPYRASCMHSVIADGKYRATKLGRNKWKSLISFSSLQKNCNREGFNVRVTYPSACPVASAVRLGIISNQENDCKTPDSRIGVGGAGTCCGQRNNNSAGNEATKNCKSDAGERHVTAFTYIFVK